MVGVKKKYRVLSDQRWHHKKDGSPNILFRKGDIVEASEIVSEPDFKTYPVVKMQGVFVAPTAPNAERNISNLTLDKVCGMRSYCKGERGCFIPLDQMEIIDEIQITSKPIDMITDNDTEKVITSGNPPLEFKKPGVPFYVLIVVAVGLFIFVQKKNI